MSEKMLNILNEDEPVSETELLQYLRGELSPEQRQELEQRLASSDLLTDAEEGLSQLKNKEQIPEIVAGLNRHIIEQLRKKRQSAKKEAPSVTMVVTVTFVLLLLIILAFLIIFKMSK